VRVEVPEDVYEIASEIARAHRLDVAEVFATACAEHVEAWEWLEKRAQRADRAKFLEVLSKGPYIEPEELA